MKILVIGKGGREHAILWKLSQSSKVTKLYCTIGNPGIEKIAECVNVAVDDIVGLKSFVVENNIDYTFVGPELPLVKGIVDAFEEDGLKIIGPSKLAAQLEGSKTFTKNLCKRYNIPTAKYEVFSDKDKALSYVKYINYPQVIKADGLAAGKGVAIVNDYDEAYEFIYDVMVDNTLGSSGNRVIIEEYLKGIELSVFAFTDGETVLMLDTAKDYKKIYDDDKGPNTGGMGTFSPVPYYNDALKSKIYDNILLPTVKALQNDGILYKGILYAGIMLVKGEPYLLEYNVRLGDPETQALMPRLKTDFVDIIIAINTQNLASLNLEWSEEHTVCVVISAEGYPGTPKSGDPITGLEHFENQDDLVVFHAGTKQNGNDVITAGGRILNIVAKDNTLEDAIEKVYRSISKIYFDGMHYRKDIGRYEE